MADKTRSGSLLHGIRPEVARRRIESFGRRFGMPHLYLAQHAAFPLALTSDLLYRLWANFQQNIYNERLNIPWVAVADLLLSNLCDVVGHELYEMNISIRTALLSGLKVNPGFGPQRINELSSFLLHDIKQQLESHNPDIQTLAKAQQWTALAYTNPDDAAKELAMALRSSLIQNDRAEQLRLASLIETFAEPLAGSSPLLTYARGIGYLVHGDVENAKNFINNKAGQASFVQIQGVHLPTLQQTTRKLVYPTLFVGLGGTGDEIVRGVKYEMLRHGYDLPIFQYLVLDTMPHNEAPNIDPDRHLQNGEEYLYIGGYNPNEIVANIANWPAIAKWWGGRDTRSIVTIDEGAGQMRALGRMGFFLHFKEIYTQLDRMVGEVLSTTNRSALLSQQYEVPADRAPIIYVVFSLCGGTGSSLFFDVAYILRKLFASMNINPTIVALAVLPEPYVRYINSRPQKERIQANTYAALQELERLHNLALGLGHSRGAIWDVEYSNNIRVVSHDLPFDYIYLIDGTDEVGQLFTMDQLFHLASQALFWLAGPPTARTFWERAKNLISNHLASGGSMDIAGFKRLSKYSSLGARTIPIDDKADLRQYKRLLEHTSCMWHVENSDITIRYDLESIGMLGFSEGPNSLSKRSEAADLLESLGEALEVVSTGITGELVLLKTVHGLPITALHGISEFHEAYQQMLVVRETPYLHLDNREDVQLGYMPLAYVDMKPIDFIQKWEQIAHDIERTDHSLAEYIRVPLQSYKQWVTDTKQITEVIQIFNGNESDSLDMLCQFIDLIQKALPSRPKTPVTIPIYVALADLISLVKSRGWIKMPDESWSRI